MSLWISDYKPCAGLSRYSPIYLFILVSRSIYETLYDGHNVRHREYKEGSEQPPALRKPTEGGNSEYWSLYYVQQERHLHDIQWQSRKGDVSSVRGDNIYTMSSEEMNIPWTSSWAAGTDWVYEAWRKCHLGLLIKNECNVTNMKIGKVTNFLNLINIMSIKNSTKPAHYCYCFGGFFCFVLVN